MRYKILCHVKKQVMSSANKESFVGSPPILNAFYLDSLNINDLTLPGSTPTRIKNKIVYYLNAINTGRYWDITVLCKGTVMQTIMDKYRDISAIFNAN